MQDKPRWIFTVDRPASYTYDFLIKFKLLIKFQFNYIVLLQNSSPAQATGPKINFIKEFWKKF